LRPGDKSPRPAAPAVGKHWQQKLALLLGLAIVGAGVWFAVNSGSHSTKTTQQPPALPTVQAKPSTNSRAARDTGSAANYDPEFINRVNHGNELLAQGKPAEAVQVLTEAVQLNPQDEDVHYNLGLALTRLGKLDEAIQEYKEALRIFPEYAEAHNNLGNVLVRAGRTEEGVAHLERAIKIMPDYASAHNNLGTALQKAGRTNDSLMYFREAVKLKPDYWQAHFNLGAGFLQEGRIIEARGEFETVLRLQPGFEPASKALEAIGAPPTGTAPARP
jgi:tetratricopeptide (TPR) repeat protein